ncbi:MAG: glycosyltransferase family 2 protein [Acidimicrobiales bacterium]
MAVQLSRPSTRPSVAVGLITRNRAHLVERWLEAVARLDVVVPDAVVVVDSSTDESTQALLDPAGPTQAVQTLRDRGTAIHTIRRRGAGYARPRNELIRRCRQLGVDWVALADDDDLPEPQWLEALLATAQASGAAVVCGPVVSKDAAAPAWVNELRSNDQRLADGDELLSVWTCNLLLSVDALDRAFGSADPFDDAFDHGGEDVELGFQLRRRGVPSAWSPEAVIVLGPTPPESLPALLRRAYVGSQMFGYSERRALGVRPRRVAASVVRFGQGLVGLADAVVARDEARRALESARVVRAVGNLRGMMRRRPIRWITFEGDDA